MRSAFLFPLSLSLVVVGCGSQVKEHAARSDLERDLTLVGQAPQTAIATPIELGRIRTATGSGSTVSSRHRIRHRAATRSTVSAPQPVQVAADPAPVPAVVQPTNTMPADPRELAPGKTVSIIPASSGISDAGAADGFSGPRFGTGGSGMGGGRAGGGSGMGGDCPRPEFGPTVGIRGLMY